MCIRKGVISNAPKFVVQKLNPVIFEISNFRSLIKSNEGHESCETFIKPEIVPPFHCNEISEPHMGKLVKVGACKSKSFGQRRNFTSEKIILIISDTTDIFQSSKVMLRDKYLIILVEGISGTEKYRVELNTSLSNVEHFIEIQVLNQRFPSVNSHRWEAFSISFLILIRTSTYSV